MLDNRDRMKRNCCVARTNVWMGAAVVQFRVGGGYILLLQERGKRRFRTEDFSTRAERVCSFMWYQDMAFFTKEGRDACIYSWTGENIKLKGGCETEAFEI